MNFFQAAVLGVVQGFSEFLPVSSSGHLVLVQNFFGITEDGLAFDVFLHFATLLAVIIYFRSDLLKLSKKMIYAIFIASIPAGLVGIFLEDYITAAFNSLTLVGVGLIITGIFNFITEHRLKSAKDPKTSISTTQALIIGLFQAFAVLPGVSRSGSTVFAGVSQNLERKLAFRFSFIMSLPVVFGANLIHVSRIVNGNSYEGNLFALMIGGALAFITGLLSLKILEIVMVKAKMNYFGMYCTVIGLLVILFSILQF
ncbi:MAG: undecaprenyl-diphosphatase 1 [Patescibacteria group bacterium]|nr:MAG: undecaprenyl-diphosphatase 1 [Patescibacteria group bacterium]